MNTNHPAIDQTTRAAARVRTLICSALFFVVISNSLFLEMNIRGKKYEGDFHYYLCVQLSLLVIAAILIFDIKREEGNLKIDKFALVICAGLAGYTLISDLVVDKKFRFAGICIFTILLILGNACIRSKSNDLYIKAFGLSVQLFLVFLLIMTVAVKDENADGRLSGPISNPSIYALYLGGIWAVLLGLMEDNILERSSVSKKILVGAEMFVTIALALMSQSLTPLIAMVAVTVLWVFRLLYRRKSLKLAVTVLITLSVTGIAVLAGLIWCARNLDMGEGSRLMEKFRSVSISAFLSNRDYYWREYLNHMNLLGHGKKPFLWDHRILPHNAIIGMAYMYGVPCVVPYILMMIMAVEKSWRYANTGLKHAAVPFYSIVSFVIMSMADNVEQPFVWLPWIACYLMMAPILIMPVEEIEALKTADKSACDKESDRYDQ